MLRILSSFELFSGKAIADAITRPHAGRSASGGKLRNSFRFRPLSFDVVLNVNFLDRKLIDLLKEALRPGGVLLFATFLTKQAEIGEPKDPRFLLRTGELRELMGGLEVTVYREGLLTYPSGKRAWRASALGVRR